MPANYSHYQFGQEVYHLLENETIKSIINNHYDLYLIGLHGPDILFYHQPLKKNKIKTKGYKMHDQEAFDFFTNAVLNTDATRAYMFGFLCHFVLDSTCHGYINECVEKTGRSHYQVEAAFEKYLMILKHVGYLNLNTAKHIVPNNENYQIIASVLEVEKTAIEKALNSMIYYHKLLVPGRYKDKIIRFALTISRHGELKGLMLGQKTMVVDQKNNIDIYELYNQAKPIAIRLIQNYDDFYHGVALLDDYFHKNYG